MGAGASTLESMNDQQLYFHVLGTTNKMIPQFEANKITGAVIAHMSETEMVEFFLSIGISDEETARTVVAAIMKIKNRELSVAAFCQLSEADFFFDFKSSIPNCELGGMKFDGKLLTGEFVYHATTAQLHDRLAELRITDPAQRAIIIARLLALKNIYCNAAAQQKVAGATAASSGTQDVATISPRACLAQIFQLQGIRLDPDDIQVAAERIAKTVGPSQASEADGTYDVFINYRVAADKVVAELLYGKLTMLGLRPFLDKVCLLNGMDWKEGFLLGLRKSRFFVALVSRKALANFRDKERDHRHDNVLIEYESALATIQSTGNNAYFIPVLVGEYLNGGSTLEKFSDFNLDLYSDKI